MIPFVGIALVVVACVFGGFGALLLKIGSAKGFRVKELLKNYHLITGLFLYGLATALFIPALKFGDLSVLYPLTSTTHVWVVLFSRVFLHEEITLWKWVGVVGIIAGVTLMSVGG